MKFIPLLFILAMCGCITTSDNASQVLKVQQAYFAELSAYYLLLDTAGHYKDDCFARETYLQQNCRAVVTKLREISIRVKEVRDLTDRAITINSEGSIVIATEKLRELQAEMKKGLASNADQPPLPPDWNQPTSQNPGSGVAVPLPQPLPAGSTPVPAQGPV